VSKNSRYLLISTVTGLGLALAGVGIFWVQNGFNSQSGEAYLQSHPLGAVAAERIPNCGPTSNVRALKAVAAKLVNLDISLDGVTRSQLDDPGYVSSQIAKDARRAAVSAIWDQVAVQERLSDIQNGLEAGSKDKTFVEPMERGHFAVGSWHGVCASDKSAQVVMFGREVEVTSSKSRAMPPEYIHVAMTLDSSGSWKLSGISHRQVTGG